MRWANAVWKTATQAQIIIHFFIYICLSFFCYLLSIQLAKQKTKQNIDYFRKTYAKVIKNTLKPSILKRTNHHYFDIDESIVFDVVTNKLPGMLETINKMIEEL